MLGARVSLMVLRFRAGCRRDQQEHAAKLHDASPGALCPVHFLAHLSTSRRHIGREGHDVDPGPVATTFLTHGEGVAPLGTSARGAA